MSEPSVWWPLPVPSSRWFTEEERRDSRAYHDPIHRAVLLRTAGQASGLVATWWLLASRSTTMSWPLVVGVVLAALTVPRLVVDMWHEFVHEPRFGTAPVAQAAFAITSLGRLGIEGGVLALGYALLQEVDGPGWPIVGVACIAAAVPLVSALIGPKFVLLVHRANDVPLDHEARRHVAAAAAAHRLPTPRVVELDQASFGGANAYVTGQRSALTVAVSHRLLNGPDALLRHVVGHEITHLRYRHLLWSAVAASGSIGLTIGASLLLTIRLADGAARLPVIVLFVAAVSQPFRLALAWLSRANERQADRFALRHAPIPPALIKQLHLSDRPLLEPSRLARWQSSHPAPAERLETAARRASRSLAP